MEQSYQYAHKHVSYIQRIIDNIFLVKILNTHKKELIKFEDNLYNFYKTEKRKFILNDINVTIPNFIAVMSFSILLIVPRFTNQLPLEFLGVTLRLVQSLSSVNSALEDYFYENLNISFEKNKHHILTGDNGSGKKSTLLGILTGALKPSSGQGLKASEKIGYIGATPLILDDTLRENLLYACTDEVDDEKLKVLLSDFKVFNESKDDVLNMQITNKTLSSRSNAKNFIYKSICK